MSLLLQTKHQEAYTPAAGLITTTRYGGTRELQRACFSVSADGTLTYVTEGGETVTDYPVKAGTPYPYWVKRITAYSESGVGGVVWIHHNGELVR